MVAQTRTPKSAWIDAGLQALAAGGPDAVRVELIAQELGVTRGGFYWHFSSRQAFLEELLNTWEHRSTDEALERVEKEGGDAQRQGPPGGHAHLLHASSFRSTSPFVTGRGATDQWPSACAASTIGAWITCAP